MFIVLRIIRGLFGLIFAYQLFGITGAPIAAMNAVANNPDLVINWTELLGWLIVKILTAFLFGGFFFGMRWIIQRLHTKLRGKPLPALVEKWWAL